MIELLKFSIAFFIAFCILASMGAFGPSREMLEIDNLREYIIHQEQRIDELRDALAKIKERK